MKVNSNNDGRDDRHTLSCVWREAQSAPASSGCPRTRFKHAACIHGNHVYICSGKDSTSPLKDFWRYHLGSGRWERLTYRGITLPHLEGHTVVPHKRILLIFGGEFSTGNSEPPLWILNTDQQHIHRPCADLNIPQPTSRRDHSALVHCGIMYIYGGFVDLRGSSSELWGYHIDDDYWKLHTPLSGETPGGRHGHSCVAYHNNMWIFGGLCDLTIKAELWAFNFLNERWQKVRAIPGPPPMTGHSADVVKDHMVIIGGENQGELYRDIWLYSFDANIWRKITLHNSPYQPLPCSQHATVCIVNNNQDESSGENSARCFSEPALQDPLPAKVSSVTSRPRTSPSTESANLSKWVYPVKSSSRNCDILSLELQSINSLETSRMGYVNTLPSNQRKISASSTVDDDRPLLRFVSRDSTDSVGIDNVIDCIADERAESHHDLSKMCSTTGLSDLAAKSPNAKEQYSFVNNLKHDFSVSIEQGMSLQPQETTNKKNSMFTPNQTSNRHTSLANNNFSSQHSKNRTPSPSNVSPTPSYSKKNSDNTPNQRPSETQNQKMICSRYCNDLFIEDIEQEQNTSPERARVPNPFTYTKDEVLGKGKQFEDWVELDYFTLDTNESSDKGRNSSASDSREISKPANILRKVTEMESSLGGLAATTKESPLHKSHDPTYKKVLVTVATQTGSNLDLRPENEPGKKDVIEKESELSFDGTPFLLVFGGKVNKGHIRQQPIKVWRCDINV